MTISAESIAEMTAVNVEMFAEAFRFNNQWANRMLKLFLRGPAARAAHTGTTYDALIDQHGSVQEASQWLANGWSRSLTVSGVEHVPKSGPLLLVCNHPGMGDAISVYATLPRTDVYTFVKVRTLLAALPNFLRYCIVLDEERPMLSVRETVRLLRAGKTVLLFPRGEMEDDPRVNLVAAVDSLNDWSQSIQTFARMVPDLTILPVAVGGVISQSAHASWLCRVYQNRDFRNYLAATLQLMFDRYRDVDVKVAFGAPLRPDGGSSIELIHIQAEMRSLLHTVGQV